MTQTIAINYFRYFFLLGMLLLCTACFGQEFELTPNPNPPQNTITLSSGETGLHSEETFENFGAIIVESGAKLCNLAEMDILVDEDGGGGGLAAIEIQAGGLLETANGTQMNFDSLSAFDVFGTVTNLGNISADWSMQFAVGSQLNNFGSIQNKQGATFRGTVSNNGLIFNVAITNGGAGFMQQIATQYDNLPGSTIHNQGELLNSTTINNDGTILNEVFQSGIGRGIFRNLTGGGAINNSTTGEITNRHRWFNFGVMNNSGLLTNHIGGLGMSNEGAGEINNLVGGTIQADKVINSSSLITNAGTVQIAGSFSTGFGIRGTGSYTQTAGQTVVNSVLQASVIDFQGGTIGGDGRLEGPINIFDGATLSPGNSVGQLDFIGDLQLDGVLLAELETPTSFDSISIDGTLTLGSTSVLEVELLNGFVPSDQDSFELVLAEQIVGDFSQIQLPPEIASLFSVAILVDEIGTTDVIRLTVNDFLLGDVNMDGLVNLLDVAPFVQLLSSGQFQAEADINGDGTVNLLDVTPFVALLSGN